MEQKDLFQALAGEEPIAEEYAEPSGEDVLILGQFAEKSYLDYAVSVVKGRALPDVSDGQKPVQRRILYSMNEMGLGPSSKPVKSARVVGDVLGKFHPHGDQSAYDAMVRLAQDFSMRYPLVEGHGNFGSRDGDGAAAMRYTEARLTPIASLLLSEIDKGTVDFIPNYDGAFVEPKLLPARLPMVLLNGASGIAVGMATEIPPHNLNEVARAAIDLIKKPDSSAMDLLEHIQGPDFPGGGQIISSDADIKEAYATGRGSIKVRARWKLEEMARGQWQIVVFELPPSVSAQKVLEEIEELTNPKIRAGKKALSQDQIQLKQLFLSQLDSVRDESGKQESVRLVFEPKSSRQNPAEFATFLLAHTSMESSVAINMVMIGVDGRPGQKGIVGILREWTDYRFETVKKRTNHRLSQVLDRIHILEGRLAVFLNIDEVIRIIRASDDPKADLTARFNLSPRQAEDILEIRLRQLAKLEGIKIEQELKDLHGEKEELEHLLREPAAMRKKIIKEIEADAKTYGDRRRTLIEATTSAVASKQVVDEAVTVTFSEKGWIKARNGHKLDVSTLGLKEGDSLLASFECRTVDQVVLIGSNGKAYSIAASQIPGGRGSGVPVTTLIDLSPGTRIVRLICGKPAQSILMAQSAGYGFVCKLGDMVSRTKTGKQFVALEENSAILPPVIFEPGPDLLLAALSQNGRLLLFPLEEMKELSSGGKGITIMALEDKEKLISMAVTRYDSVAISGAGRGGKAVQESLNAGQILHYIGKRARKGKALPFKMKASGFSPEQT